MRLPSDLTLLLPKPVKKDATVVCLVKGMKLKIHKINPIKYGVNLLSELVITFILIKTNGG